ncbi:hypothetical protein CP557_20080 [Natrinema ejinorense]|uniref:Uncharacterized protein n=2 Tax=Natrinema ejinorense TaxID=373386 RepID=A0A2A5QQF4_9EURY|nr:hypothetical protein CP557_20080 [Natrinema ejinorense]
MDNPSRVALRRWIMLTALALIAIAVLLVGLAAVSPSLRNALRHPRDDIFLITGFLVVAISGGSLLLLPVDEIAEDDNTDAYEPEVTPEIPYAGADLEPLMTGPFFERHISPSEQREIRTRLRETATRTIRRHTGAAMSETRDTIQRGDWTENAVAAWFLGETSPPRSVRLYARLSDELAFRYGARRTVHEIIAYEHHHEDTEERTP